MCWIITKDDGKGSARCTQCPNGDFEKPYMEVNYWRSCLPFIVAYIQLSNVQTCHMSAKDSHHPKIAIFGAMIPWVSVELMKSIHGHDSENLWGQWVECHTLLLKRWYHKSISHSFKSWRGHVVKSKVRCMAILSSQVSRTIFLKNWTPEILTRGENMTA